MSVKITKNITTSNKSINYIGYIKHNKYYADITFESNNSCSINGYVQYIIYDSTTCIILVNNLKIRVILSELDEETLLKFNSLCDYIYNNPKECVSVHIKCSIRISNKVNLDTNILKKQVGYFMNSIFFYDRKFNELYNFKQPLCCECIIL